MFVPYQIIATAANFMTNATVLTSTFLHDRNKPADVTESTMNFSKKDVSFQVSRYQVPSTAKFFRGERAKRRLT